MSLSEGILATVIVAIFLMLPASVFIYRGLKHRVRYRRFREAALKTPATVTPGETALVTGQAQDTVEPGDGDREGDHDSVTGPLSQKTVVLTAWEIHSLRRWGRLGIKRAWAPEALAIETNGFSIVDDRSEVAVPDWRCRNRLEGKERLSPTGTGMAPLHGLDVDGVWMELETYEKVRQVRPTGQPPEELATLETRAGVESINTSSGFLARMLARIRTPAYTRLYRETTVEAGQRVTVWGRVREPLTPGKPLRMTKPDDGHALITTVDPETLQKRYRWSYWKSVYLLPLFIFIFASFVGLAFVL